MATSNHAEKATVKAQEKPPLVPPDERFWQRYSPHHEFPLSSATSALVHLLVLGILALGARTLANWNQPLPLDTIEIGGGSGGSPSGEEGGQGKFTRSESLSDIKDSTTERPKTKVAGEDLQEVKSKPKELLKNPEDQRVINESDIQLGKNLSEVGNQVRDRLNAMQAKAAKGADGSGGGGGAGKGKGPGTGDGVGPGSGTISKRQERQKRWTMIFNIRNPEDYARQLHALGAMIAVPGPNGQYLVIEDLSQRPAVARARDVKDINRMFWIDDKPEAVEPLFRVLEYTPVPNYFVAFFPQELERELLKKELAFKNMPENRIEETRFQIRRTASGYEPVVTQQDLK